MGDRRVTRSAKDRDGDITGLCGDWGMVSKADAVTHISRSVHRYYVQDSLGERAEVRIYGGQHLRTDPNSSCRDNLDSLPDC